MLKKEAMRRWLTDRLLLQSRLVVGAMVAMLIIGLIATAMEFTVFYLIIRVGFISSSKSLAFLVTLLILGALQYVVWLMMPKQLVDTEHEAELDDGMTLVRVAPNMTAVWTYALGSRESDRSWVEILLGILTLPQRSCSAAWFTWHRLEELKTVAVQPCAAVIRLLHKEGERVELKKIAAEITIEDLPATVRQLSLIDGIVFLTRRSVGLSLANRLVDDIIEWKQKTKSAEEGAND